MSFLKATAIGNIGNISDLKYTESGLAIIDFSLATNEKVKNKSGEWEKVTTWIKCTIFGKAAENFIKYVSVGKMVYVDGKLRQNTWETKDGVTKTTLEMNVSDVQFLSFDDKKEEVESVESNKNKTVTPTVIKNDDIPF